MLTLKEAMEKRLREKHIAMAEFARERQQIRREEEKRKVELMKTFRSLLLEKEGVALEEAEVAVRTSNRYSYFTVTLTPGVARVCFSCDSITPWPTEFEGRRRSKSEWLYCRYSSFVDAAIYALGTELKDF